MALCHVAKPVRTGHDIGRHVHCRGYRTVHGTLVGTVANSYKKPAQFRSALSLSSVLPVRSQSSVAKCSVAVLRPPSFGVRSTR